VISKMAIPLADCPPLPNLFCQRYSQGSCGCEKAMGDPVKERVAELLKFAWLST
jgi:hypothetical protein